jgi:hypothetical protein
MNDFVDIKASLKAGTPVRFKKDAPASERTISAATIMEAACNAGRVEIMNAIITGILDFRNTTIPAEICLVLCQFTAGVDFSYSTLERNLTLSCCEFAGRASFQSTTCRYDLRLNGSRFNCDNIGFRNIHVGGNCSAKRATFGGRVIFDDAEFGPDVDFSFANFKRNVSFNSVRIKGCGHFSGSVFENEAEFSRMETTGDVDFRSCRFQHDNSSTNFDVIKVDGDMSFDSAVFAGDASFDGTRVHGAASFANAEFLKSADFNDVKVDGDLGFEDAKIGGEAKFVGLVIGGGAIFQKARFQSSLKTHFDLTRFEGGLFFQGVQFSGDVSFRGVESDSVARFSGATFGGLASFEASKFTGLAEFRSGEWSDVQYSGTTFNQLSLKHTRFEHDARFDDAIFRGKADFRDTLFRIVYFSESGSVVVGTEMKPQFQGEIDLRGCNYKTVIANWKSLLPLSQESVGYNRQPYTQLEKFYSESGETELANKVYLQGRKAERLWKWKKKRYFSWFVDLMYFSVLRYGVRPFQLLIFATLLLLVGTYFFTRPHVVSVKDTRKLSEGKKTEDPPTVLSMAEAFQLSLHQFIPVEIPMGEHWIPADIGEFRIKPTTFATLFLRLPGWILVPLGIASFTRLLRSGGAKGGGAE